jgi:hypothetical protein
MMDRGLPSDSPSEPTYGNTYKANQISAPTAETLAAIAKTADACDIAILVTQLGLVFRHHKRNRSIVSSLSWLELQSANDPHGMCAVEFGRMRKAVE